MYSPKMCCVNKTLEVKRTFVWRVLEEGSVKASAGVKFLSELVFEVTCVSALIGISLVTIALKKQRRLAKVRNRLNIIFFFMFKAIKKYLQLISHHNISWCSHFILSFCPSLR